MQSAVENAMDGSIDIYDIYEDVCLEPTHERLQTQTFMLMDERRNAVHQSHVSHRGGSAEAAEAHPPKHMQHASHGRRAQTTISPIFPTCIDKSSSAYLNSPAVQAAIHVRPGTVPKGKWSDCGNVDYEFNYASELPNYERWAADGTLQMLMCESGSRIFISRPP